MDDDLSFPCETTLKDGCCHWAVVIGSVWDPLGLSLSFCNGMPVKVTLALVVEITGYSRGGNVEQCKASVIIGCGI